MGTAEQANGLKTCIAKLNKIQPTKGQTEELPLIRSPVPPHLLDSEPGLRQRVALCSDYFVQLESFQGEEKVNSVYKGGKQNILILKILEYFIF